MIKSREKNDCSVVALANATGKPYEECYSILESLGRKKGCSVNAQALAAACLRTGGRLKLFACDYRDQYLAPKRTYARYAAFLKSGNFVVIAQQHAFCVKDSDILDEAKISNKEEIVSVYYFK